MKPNKLILCVHLYLDIKTEDGLSHSPGQTGILGYSNFSSTPPSQSLYSYSHTHGQSETLHALNVWSRDRTRTLHAPSLISTLLEGASIRMLPSLTPLLLVSSPLRLVFLSFPPAHLFSISRGLDSWRQKSPRPSSFLGVRPPFSTQTNNTACERWCLLGRKRP